MDRDEAAGAAEAFGVDLKEHIQFVTEAMRGIAGELGLEGEKHPATDSDTTPE